MLDQVREAAKDGRDFPGGAPSPPRPPSSLSPAPVNDMFSLSLSSVLGAEQDMQTAELQACLGCSAWKALDSSLVNSRLQKRLWPEHPGRGLHVL